MNREMKVALTVLAIFLCMLVYVELGRKNSATSTPEPLSLSLPETPVIFPPTVEDSVPVQAPKKVSPTPLASPKPLTPKIVEKPKNKSPLIETLQELPPDSLPASKVAAPVSENKVYVIKAGDTLSRIAQEQMGSFRLLSDLLKANPEVDPNHITIGYALKIPKVDLPKHSDEFELAARQKLYIVEKDDNLYKIAVKALGSGGRWKEIIELNPGCTPDKLKIGMKLRLPSR